MLTQDERSTLRKLAQDYAQIASLPAQQQKQSLWIACNDRQNERPLVLIDQVCWNEMDMDGSLVEVVAHPYWNGVERWLRQKLYAWRHMRVDQVLNPYIELPRLIISSGWGLDAVIDTLRMEPDSAIASQRMHNQIHDFDDLQRIHAPQIRLDTAQETEILQTADSLFSDILPYQMVGATMHLGLWDLISHWMGVENCYLALMDRPELIHALMEKLTEGTIAQIQQMNAQGLHDVHSHLCHCSHTFMQSLPGPESDPDHPVAADTWAFGMAQLFTAASPEITQIFEVEYMRRIFPYFGAIYYGCCERLDDRLDILAALPKVKKISCSPWSDKDRFAQLLPEGCIMSCKPSPALLATDTMDEMAVRADLQESIRAARRHGRQLELILKDISTVRHDPARLWRWAEIAMEEVQR